MKLSKDQIEIIKLMQEGWACGIHTCTSGFTKIFNRGVLQKFGLGYGAPIKDVKAVSIYALERKCLIERFGVGDGMIKPIEFKLTNLGKNVSCVQKENGVDKNE